MLEEGRVYEECPRCMTSGALEDEDGQLFLCDKCEAEGYILHECEPELV